MMRSLTYWDLNVSPSSRIPIIFGNCGDRLSVQKWWGSQILSSQTYLLIFLLQECRHTAHHCHRRILVLSKSKRAATTADVEKACDDSVFLGPQTSYGRRQWSRSRVPAEMPVNDIQRDRRPPNSYSGRNDPNMV